MTARLSLLLTLLVVLLSNRCSATGGTGTSLTQSINDSGADNSGDTNMEQQLTDVLKTICEELMRQFGQQDSSTSSSDIANRCLELINSFGKSQKHKSSHQNEGNKVSGHDQHSEGTPSTKEGSSKMSGYSKGEGFTKSYQNTEKSISKLAKHQNEGSTEAYQNSDRGVTKMSTYGQYDDNFMHQDYVNKMGAKRSGHQQYGYSQTRNKGSSKNSGHQYGHQGKTGGKDRYSDHHYNDDRYDGPKDKKSGHAGGFMDDIHDKMKGMKNGMKHFMGGEEHDGYGDHSGYQYGSYEAEGKGKKDFLNFSGMKNTFQKMKGMLGGKKHKHQQRRQYAGYQGAQEYQGPPGNQGYQGPQGYQGQQDSDIYFVRLPPAPYSYVDGVGYISRPPTFSAASLEAAAAVPGCNHHQTPYLPEPADHYPNPTTYVPELHFQHVRPEYKPQYPTNPQLQLQSQYSGSSGIGDSGSSSSVEPLIRVPINFVSNGKPTGVYQWPPQLHQQSITPSPQEHQQTVPPSSQEHQQPISPDSTLYQQSIPAPPKQENHYEYNHPLDQQHGLTDSPIIRLDRGPYMFNGKPQNVFKMKVNKKLPIAKTV